MMARLGFGAVKTKLLRISSFNDLNEAWAPEKLDIFLKGLAKTTAATFGIEAQWSGRPPPPAFSYDRRRRQYAASGLLAGLAATNTGNTLTLGVTAVDLFIPKLNFVFGVADRDMGVAIISLHRLSPEFYSKEQDQNLLKERAAKEAIHEVGHLLGLTHCDDASCVMHFSNAIGNTDIKGPGFCVHCAQRLI